MKVAPMAAANSTDPRAIVAPFPIRLLSFPDKGPAKMPTPYDRYISVMT